MGLRIPNIPAAEEEKIARAERNIGRLPYHRGIKGTTYAVDRWAPVKPSITSRSSSPVAAAAAPKH
jgi:hypothetical protein